MKRAIIITIVSTLIMSLMLIVPKTYNEETKRVLVVCGEDCEKWDITHEKDLFLDFYARDADETSYLQGGTVEEIQTKIETFFAKADNNDINIICFIGHGNEDMGLFGKDIITDRQIADAVNTINGHTALFFSCCYGGSLGENVYNKLNLDDVAVISTCGNKPSYVGTGEVWSEKVINFSDGNMNNKISIGELYKVIKKRMVQYNTACCAARHVSSDKVTEPMMFGNADIEVASVDVSYGYMDYMSEQINKIKQLFASKN